MIREKPWIKPYGYLTSGDIAQISPLKGQQVHYFLKDYGVEIDGRMCIKESTFRALEDHWGEYRGYPMYSAQVRKKGLKKRYRRRVK